MSEHTLQEEYGAIKVTYSIDITDMDTTTRWFGMDPIQELEYNMKYETFLQLAEYFKKQVVDEEELCRNWQCPVRSILGE